MPSAIITGASRGIGAACAELFAANGYDLAICCRNSEEELKTLAGALEEKYRVRVLTFCGNVAEEAFVSSMTETVKRKFGRPDVLVNNAGISHIGLLSDMSLAEWNEIVSVNLTSVFLFSKYVIPSMVSEKRGKIINVSSVWGCVGASCEAAYSACKGGINALTRALGRELAPSNIQVNAVAFGCVDTAMNACFSSEERAALEEEIPAGRFASPREAAEFVFALTEHEYLNGQVIPFDGAWT